MQKNIIWISFDVDYLGGSATSTDYEYSCIRQCDHCTQKQGRPKTQILSKKESEMNTIEMIQLIDNSSIKKAYMRQCHASIIDLIHAGDSVYNIDAHHDNYYPAFTKKDVNCGNWVSWAKKHNIKVKTPCTPLEVENSIKNKKNNIYLYICTSPNYASPQTDEYLMEILHSIPCKIDVDLRK